MKRLLVLLGSLVAACSASEEADPNVANVCIDGQGRYLSGLSPVRTFDYIALRRSILSKDGGEVVVEEWGTPCGGATDGACSSQLAVHLGLGWLPPSSKGEREYLLATIGDDVIFYASSTDLLKFLGPIDTFSDAALLVRSSGRSVDCTRSPNAFVSSKGFRLLSPASGSCVDAIDVMRDGTMTVERGYAGGESCGGIPPP